MTDAHYLHSVLRERTIEHLLIGQLLQRLWCHGNAEVEILRSEFDRGGYDLVADAGRVVRHIQLKCSRMGGATAGQKVSLNLAQKPSGCILWIVAGEDLSFDHFLWFGGDPGEPLPDIERYRVAKHAKANAQGVKMERLNLRVVPKRDFERLDTLDNVLDRLFGPSWRGSKEPPHPTLDYLVEGITPENRHEVIDWGPDVGKERWEDR